MIFNEIYSLYYKAVSKIISESIKGTLDKKRLKELIDNNAFLESYLEIEPKLLNSNWQIINPDLSTNIKKEPNIPFSELELRWFKAILEDKRVKLFIDDIDVLPDVKPLFNLEDIVYFDKYLDGDNYEDHKYIKNFRSILDAIKNKKSLEVKFFDRNRNTLKEVIKPEYLEYSEKDDKFRLVGTSKKRRTINLSRIIDIKECPLEKGFSLKEIEIEEKEEVTFELFDFRKALERVLLNFAHFEKEVKHIEDKKYLVKINYDRSDETEILIRILSYGPMIKVVSPNSFIELVKERLTNQKNI